MMKRIPSVLLAALLCCSIHAKEPIRVGSYNLRMQQLDKGENAWELRRPRVMQSIRDNNFDVVGLQELTDFAQEQLREDLGNVYDFVFFSPYSQDGKGSKAHGIAWKKGKYELLECHRFWPSDTPDSCCVNDIWVRKNKTSKFKRGAMCCLFRTTSGKKFIFICSHAALNKEMNGQFAHVMIDREKMYNPDGLPSFFVGDLNTAPDSPSSELWRSHWTDAALCMKGRPLNTFNAFKSERNMAEEGSRIDYIYFRGKAKFRKYFCNTSLYDGHCASDHYPIWADFLF